MTKFQSQFEQHKFVASLPEILVVVGPLPPIPSGAALDGDFDLTAVQIDNRVLMRQIFYTTNAIVHGLLHYDGANQLFFMGYQCGECDKVFLVPDSVTDFDKLSQAMRHGCMGIPK